MIHSIFLAGPGGIVRIQTVDTIEFFGNDLLTSTSFTPMKQYPGTPPDNNCPSPCSSKDKVCALSQLYYYY